MSGSMLVIEDDETFSATLVRALKRRGYAVVAARSAAEAFECATAGVPVGHGVMWGIFSLISPRRICRKCLSLH